MTAEVFPHHLQLTENLLQTSQTSELTAHFITSLFPLPVAFKPYLIVNTVVKPSQNKMNKEISENMKNVTLSENKDVNNTSTEDEDIVDPWNVVGKADTGIDYDKLISNVFILYP